MNAGKNDTITLMSILNFQEFILHFPIVTHRQFSLFHIKRLIEMKY